MFPKKKYLHAPHARTPKNHISLLSDEEVLHQSILSPNLFGEVVMRYEDAFVRHARHILGNREEVYDVVQDTFTKIYINASRFKKKEGACFSSWAYTILRNTAFSEYKRLKKESFVLERMPDAAEDILLSYEDALRDPFVERHIISVFSRMPRLLSRILQRYFIEGVPQKEIAREFGITHSAVKTRVYRAKKEFKKIFFEMSPAFKYDNEY